MNEVRRAHFAQSRNLIGQSQGREIKTIGDSFMAAFKSMDAALDYVRPLQGNTAILKNHDSPLIEITPFATLSTSSLRNPRTTRPRELSSR